MHDLIELNGLNIKVVKKNIKNLHLSVYPPVGQVHISAPLHMKTDHIRVFAITKLNWIKQQQKRFQQQSRQSLREYLDLESHYVWGKRYLFKTIVSNDKGRIELKHKEMHLYLPLNQQHKKECLVNQWYRQQLKQVIKELLVKWQPIIGVQVKQLYIQRMKTKWGSCNPSANSIRFNTELAKQPLDYIEYVVVHEIMHLLEPTHNKRFVALMNHFMPHWRFYRKALNHSLLSQEDWKYK